MTTGATYGLRYLKVAVASVSGDTGCCNQGQTVTPGGGWVTWTVTETQIRVVVVFGMVVSGSVVATAGGEV